MKQLNLEIRSEDLCKLLNQLHEILPNYDIVELIKFDNNEEFMQYYKQKDDTIETSLMFELYDIYILYTHCDEDVRLCIVYK